jgi:ABC-type nitrate/sulfonate/bicarbonate transport system permease component
MSHRAYVRYALLIATFLTAWKVANLALGSFRIPAPEVFLPYTFSSFLQDGIINREGGGSRGFSVLIWATVCSLVPSLVIGGVTGILFGIIGELWLSRVIPFAIVLEAIRTIPPIIFVPFYLLATGPGYHATVLSGAVCTFLAMSFYALLAVRNLDANMIFLARLLGAGQIEMAFRISLPSILPHLVSGMRSTLSLTLGIIVLAEYLGSSIGLGRTLKYAISYGSSLLLFTAVFWAVLVGLLFDWLLSKLIGHLLRWRPSEASMSAGSRHRQLLLKSSPK